MATQLDDLDRGAEGPMGGDDLASQIIMDLTEEQGSGGGQMQRAKMAAKSITDSNFGHLVLVYAIIVTVFVLVTHPVVTRFLARSLSGSFLFPVYGRLIVRIIQGSVLALLYLIWNARNN